MRNKEQYPENWNDTIRPRILSRDNFTCQDCRVKHRDYIFIDQNHKVIKVDRKEHEELKNEGLKTYRIYLQVAHKDNVKSNCSDNNLISLCPRCHHKRDKIHKGIMRLSNSLKGLPTPPLPSAQADPPREKIW